MATTPDAGVQDVRYQPDERPPHGVALGLGMQYAMLAIAGIVLTAAIVVRAAGGSDAYLSWATFAALAPCPVHLAPGNHDWYSPDSLYALVEWSRNVHVFREPRLRPAPLAAGLTLWGAAHCAPAHTGNFFEGFEAAGPGVHVALCHAAERSAPAAQGDAPDAIAALLAGGAAPNARREEGWTPLHTAVEGRALDAIAALLHARADAGLRNANGQLPFDLIADDSPLVGTDVYWRLSDARWR